MRREGPALGCIADDFTGAVDVAAGVFAAGLRAVIVTSGDPGPDAADADVVVIALKSRTAPVEEAVAASVQAARTLLALGVGQLLFKYCSTFDSTDRGNIGPVADRLAELVGQDVTVVVPGYPATGRTVRDGLLYVDGTLLSDSAMRTHPLTPMTSSDVPGLLARQSRHPVGLVRLPAVRAGDIASALRRVAATGARYAVFDTVTDTDLDTIAAAVAGTRLVTGGAALAHALARRSAPRIASPVRPPVPGGRCVVLSGSCSQTTLRQVAEFARTRPVLPVRADALADPEQAAATAVRWAMAAGDNGPLLISTSASPDEVARVQAELGRARAASRVERFFAAAARLLVDHGVRRLLVAGGETSGAVCAGLGVRELDVVAPLGAGLAWCVSRRPAVALALKSGNFGADELFARAPDVLEETRVPEGSA